MTTRGKERTMRSIDKLAILAFVCGLVLLMAACGEDTDEMTEPDKLWKGTWKVATIDGVDVKTDFEKVYKRNLDLVANVSMTMRFTPYTKTHRMNLNIMMLRFDDGVTTLDFPENSWFELVITGAFDVDETTFLLSYGKAEVKVSPALVDLGIDEEMFGGEFETSITDVAPDRGTWELDDDVLTLIYDDGTITRLKKIR